MIAPATSASERTRRRRCGRRRVTGALCGLVIVLAGCGSSGGTPSASSPQATEGSAVLSPAPSSTGPPPQATTPSDPPPTADCDAIDGNVELPGGTALLRSPATDHPRAAVVMLHGYTATPEGEETVTGWTSFLGGTDAVVVYPRGNPIPQGGFGWTTGTERFSTSGTDDVAALDRTLGWLVSANCVDPDQILLTGESNGGAMTLLAGCSGALGIAPRLFALVIPAVDSNVTDRCAGSAPFPLVAFAGRLDATVPYGGRADDPGSPEAPRVWFGELADTLQGCTVTPVSHPVPGGSVDAWENCSAATAFFTIDEGRHTWPGGPTGTAGLDPGTVPTSALTWCMAGLTATPAPVDDCDGLLVTYGLPRA